jgi:NhaA family Na+:H+ antiporter
MSRLFHLVIDNSLLLVAGAVTALVWANVDLESYNHTAHAMHFAVNDIGMVFFFALAMKEVVEATLPGAALSEPRKAAVPVLAAVGGMLVPSLIFLLGATGSHHEELTRGWAIPCATDIAFSYMVSRVIFPKSSPAIPFLLLLAIADDALGLVILALFYPSAPLSIVWLLVLVVPAVLLAWGLKRMRVKSFWAYLAGPGVLAWAGLFLGGIHPALALVPIVPFMPSARRDLGLFDPREEFRKDTLDRFEHAFKIPVQFVLFFFGLANAGVPLGSVGIATWLVLAGLLLGKPIGVVGMTLLAETLGFKRPHGLSTPDLAVLGMAAGIGFTVALFFAAAAYQPGVVLEQAKMGALLSFLAGPLAIAAGRALKLKR